MGGNVISPFEGGIKSLPKAVPSQMDGAGSLALPGDGAGTSAGESPNASNDLPSSMRPSPSSAWTPFTTTIPRTTRRSDLLVRRTVLFMLTILSESCLVDG